MIPSRVHLRQKSQTTSSTTSHKYISNAFICSLFLLAVFPVSLPAALTLKADHEREWLINWLCLSNWWIALTLDMQNYNWQHANLFVKLLFKWIFCFKIKYCHLISCTFIQDLLTPQVTVRPTLTNIHDSVILKNANCLHNNDMSLFVVPFFSSSSLNYEHKNVPSDSEPPCSTIWSPSDWQQLHFSPQQWSQTHFQCSKSTPG